MAYLIDDATGSHRRISLYRDWAQWRVVPRSGAFGRWDAKFARQASPTGTLRAPKSSGCTVASRLSRQMVLCELGATGNIVTTWMVMTALAFLMTFFVSTPLFLSDAS